MEDNKNNIRISLMIPKDMDNYLHSHPEINRSELFRNTINTIRNPITQKLSDALIVNFIVTILVMFGFLVILLSPFISVFFLIILYLITSTSLIGGTLLFITIRRSKSNGTNGK